MSGLEFWKEQTTKAFDGDSKSNDFVLFFEGCKTLTSDGLSYSWTTTEYDEALEKLECFKQANHIWTLPITQYTTLSQLKSQVRSQWHSNRQIQLKRHLELSLQTISPAPASTISVEQRLELVREFMRTHQNDLGSVPFIKGLCGLLKYQLQHPSVLVDWRISEYVLTQNNEEAMESYIRLMKGAFGLQLVYQDEENATVIQMDSSTPNETTLVWRTSNDTANLFIQQSLKILSKQVTSFIDYKATDIPRTTKEEHKNLLQWIYDFVYQCLVFLHIK